MNTSTTKISMNKQIYEFARKKSQAIDGMNTSFMRMNINMHKNEKSTSQPKFSPNKTAEK